MDDPQDIARTEETTERSRTLHRAAKIAAIAGIAYAILFVISFLLLSQVPHGASNEEFIAFYESEQRTVSVFVALYLMPFAGISFLWFIVVLRMWIGSRATEP